MQTMSPSEWLSLLNILVAFLGVAFGVFAFIEWFRLRALRKRLEELPRELEQRMEQHMRAAHRIIASYSLTSTKDKISLLESTLESCPQAFNGYNALGYAYLESGNTAKAIDAFVRATCLHPDDKAGYCDLAYAHLQAGNTDMMLRNCRMAIKVDPTARQDLAEDDRFKDYREQILG